MLTSAAALMRKTAEQSFWNNYFSYVSPFDRLIYTKESTQKIDTYTRLGAAPMPTEWVGDGDTKSLPEFAYDGTNKFWRAAIRVDKELIRFQQWDEIANAQGNLGTKARQQQLDQRISAFLNNAHTTAGADTQFFFDTDHVWPGAEYTTVWDNDLTANITDPLAPTAAEMQTALRAMIKQLHLVKDDRGDPELPTTYNAADFILVYPPRYVNIVHQVLTVDSITNPGDNDLKGRFTARPGGFVTDPTSTSGVMFMFLAGTPRFPLILQRNGAIMRGDNLEGDEYRNSGNAVFDVFWVGEAIPGDHGRAVRYEFT